MDKKSEVEKVTGDIVTLGEDGEIEEGFYIVTIKKPYKFDGEIFEKIDLTGLESISAEDMIAVNKEMNRNGNIDFMPEMSMEYALRLAARATKKSYEFYKGLKPSTAMKIKNCVTHFLYNGE